LLKRVGELTGGSALDLSKLILYLTKLSLS